MHQRQLMTRTCRSRTAAYRRQIESTPSLPITTGKTDGFDKAQTDVGPPLPGIAAASRENGNPAWRYVLPRHQPKLGGTRRSVATLKK